MGSVHQTYADVIFEAASHRLGRQVAAPQVLQAFDDEPESEVPVATEILSAEACTVCMCVLRYEQKGRNKANKSKACY